MSEHHDEADLVGFTRTGPSDWRQRAVHPDDMVPLVIYGESHRGDFVAFVPYEDANGWRFIDAAPENRLVDVWAGGQRFPDHFRRGTRWFDRKGVELFLPPSHYRLAPDGPAHA